jgi:hypothetical protein
MRSPSDRVYPYLNKLLAASVINKQAIELTLNWL